MFLYNFTITLHTMQRMQYFLLEFFSLEDWMRGEVAFQRSLCGINNLPKMSSWNLSPWNIATPSPQKSITQYQCDYYNGNLISLTKSFRNLSLKIAWFCENGFTTCSCWNNERNKNTYLCSNCYILDNAVKKEKVYIVSRFTFTHQRYVK